MPYTGMGFGRITVLHLGVTLPSLGSLDELAAVGGIQGAARHLERLGFESAWVADLTIGDGTPALEPVAALAAAAAATDRLRLGFSTLVLPLREPAAVAAQLQTLQYVSGNRVLLGVGIGGYPEAPYWSAVGAQKAGRGRRTDDALTVLPRLVEGAEADGLRLAPAAPMPPVLIGGTSAAAQRRAARYGDGWFPSLLTPQELGESTERLADLAAAQGRPTPSVTVGGHAQLSGDTAARDSFVRTLVDTHGMAAEQAARVPVTGSPAEAAEHLAAYAAAGAERAVLSFDGSDWLKQSEQLARARDLLG
ncbi:LLM class flavin-dependent oxidoreductase [Streptomyces boninensis]|uniref:LLM class flavin-dependent oxidoreductase n=1 Tax=Streptomyces boninensis TaxID=2039455 RepID=UPI003B2180C5